MDRMQIEKIRNEDCIGKQRLHKSSLLMAWSSEPSLGIIEETTDLKSAEASASNPNWLLKAATAKMAMEASQKRKSISNDLVKGKIESLRKSLNMLQTETKNCSSTHNTEEDHVKFKMTLDSICMDVSSLYDIISSLNESDNHQQKEEELDQEDQELPIQNPGVSALGLKRRLSNAVTFGQDISVAFFGLDWANTFSVLDSIEAKVQQMQSDDANLVSSLISLIMPTQIMADLAKLEADITAHGEAVLRGRTSLKHKEHIRSEQRRMSLQTVNLGVMDRRFSSGAIFETSHHGKGLFANLMSLVRKRCHNRPKSSAPGTASELEQLRHFRGRPRRAEP